jgi:hypothetical protein
MTPAEALFAIKRAAMTHQLTISGHAYQRMDERGLTIGDIEHACLAASAAARQANERWRLDSHDQEGDVLTVVATIEANVIVVTVF